MNVTKMTNPALSVLAACALVIFGLRAQELSSSMGTDSYVSLSGPRLDSIKILSSSISRSSGDGWSVVDLSQLPRNDFNYSCRWSVYKAATNGNTAPICLHDFQDVVSDYVEKHGHWKDCDILPSLWKQGNMGPNTIYVEIGANIGACLMEMLLATDASVIAFEPNPRNQFSLISTLHALPAEVRNRIAVFPIALGDVKSLSTIFSAKNNMGNSVVGSVIKDRDSQVFEEKEQHQVHIERLDSVLSENILDVGLMKMDAQGFECKILEGWGSSIANKIQQVRFEWASKWLLGQDCHDLLPRFRHYGFQIIKNNAIVTGDSVSENIIDLLARRSFDM